MSVISPGDGAREEALASLYRSSPRDEPPPALDAAICAAAHRAVGARPTTAARRIRRWQVPFSIAAVLVVSASLVMLMREEAPELVEPPRADLPALPAPAERDVTQGGGLASSEPEARRKSLATAPRQEGANLGLQPPRDPAVPSIGMRDTEPTVQGFGSAVDSPGGRDSGSPTAATRAPAQAFPGTAVPPPRADPPPERRRGDDLQRSAPRASAPAGERPGDSGLKPGSPAAAHRRAPSEPETAESKSASKSETTNATERVREQAKPRMQALPERAEKPVRELAGATAPDIELPPEKWLEQISALRREGRIEAARASFAEFRRRYPAYPLPGALKDWETP